jgi:hypothetical protein
VQLGVGLGTYVHGRCGISRTAKRCFRRRCGIFWTAKERGDGRGDTFGSDFLAISSLEGCSVRLLPWDSGWHHEGLLLEEIGLNEKKFPPPSCQERQGKTDALVF